MEVAVLQTKKIAELEAKLEQQLANSATSKSIPGRIPATIDTSNSGSTTGGGSMNSTVTKEEMMQMFTQFQKNFQQGQCTEITTPAPKEKRKANLEPITFQMTWAMENDRNADTWNQQTIVHPVAMISNRPTHLSHPPIKRKTIMRQQPSITRWSEPLLIATLPNDGVGR